MASRLPLFELFNVFRDVAKHRSITGAGENYGAIATVLRYTIFLPLIFSALGAGVAYFASSREQQKLEDDLLKLQQQRMEQKHRLAATQEAIEREQRMRKVMHVYTPMITIVTVLCFAYTMGRYEKFAPFIFNKVTWLCSICKI